MVLNLSDEDRRHARRVLVNMRSLLPGRWGSGSDARDGRGNETTPSAEEAEQFCIVGALRRCSRKSAVSPQPALYALHETLCGAYPWMKDIPAADDESKADVLREWNDGTASGILEVLALINCAIWAAGPRLL